MGDYNYRYLTTEDKVNILQQRIRHLEGDHYQHGVIAGEIEAATNDIGDVEAVQGHRMEQGKIEKRIGFIERLFDEMMGVTDTAKGEGASDR